MLELNCNWDLPLASVLIEAVMFAFWNAVAGDYDADPGNVAAPGTPAYAAWAQAIRSVLPTAPSAVLDLGTGTGYVASIVAELGHRVTGLDLSEKMLAVARAKALDARLEVSFQTGDAVARVFDQAQQREYVLDMGGVEEFQAAEFDVGNITPCQLHLQRAAVMGGTE